MIFRTFYWMFCNLQAVISDKLSVQERPRNEGNVVQCNNCHTALYVQFHSLGLGFDCYHFMKEQTGFSLIMSETMFFLMAYV